MEEIKLERNHLNKPVYRSKRKKKAIVKVMINRRNSKEKHEDVKKDFKNHKMLGRKVRKSGFFFFF